MSGRLAFAEPMRRLAERVVGGEVVFFIGSGFSIDSEQNRSDRLIRRLLIRLLAIADTLATLDAQGVVTDLRGTFGLDPAPAATEPFRFTPADVRTLATRYYETNDWFCVAYGCLLEQLADVGAPEAIGRTVNDINRRENDIRLTGGSGGAALDPVALEPIEQNVIALTKRDARLAGKALFLDTMGFRNSLVMGGKPKLASPVAAAESYGAKLLPRHHVVARLAREGFCNATITANFDLLLEGAFRVAGFTLSDEHETKTDPFTPKTRYESFARIASPPEFFKQGKPERDPIIVKMHGCAEQYRELSHDEALLCNYLPSLVFTYREIQNWRQDSWAADYLRTLLRTRTVVFCGYSVQDPVIHDTFRTVYEEMADHQHQQCGSAEDAPAFFLAPSNDARREFHGMEVLHAASRAVGTVPAPFGRHPNYIPFHFRGTSFPSVDEELEWLAHAVVRIRQKEALASYLRRMVITLLRRPQASAELTAVQDRFEAMRAAEQTAAESWDDSPISRRALRAICSWTSHFHAGLLREFAAVEMVHLRQGPSRELSVMRQLPWYYPTTAAEGWTCWGAVVELALRNMIDAIWNGRPVPAHELKAADSLAPTILFPESPTARTPVALAIRFCGFERHGRAPRITGYPSRVVTWELSKNDAPWPIDAGTTSSGGGKEVALSPPSALQMWNWAAGHSTDAAEARTLLGLTER
jgi:hypothetical protein